MDGQTLDPPGLELPKVRCAPFHLDSGADPGGSAGAYDAFLCVEVPLPWDRDISMHEPFASFVTGPSVRGVDGRTWRPQGLVPRPGAEGWVRVLAFERNGDPGPFTRREWWVEPDVVGSLCRALVEVDLNVLATFDDRSVAVDEHTIDLMICTHGRRDACCGGSGSTLADAALRLLAGEIDAGSVRVWRTSHTGGHRFAPTALTFPDGFAWAHLDEATLAELVRRDGDVASIAGHCRGAASVIGAPAQMADRAALAEVGWSWASGARRVEVVDFDRRTLDTLFAVHGAGRSMQVRVTLDRHIPQPSCGLVEGPEYSVEPVWSAVVVG